MSYSKEDGSETVYVGRSMYETDQIPSEWLSPAACLVDQLWLPSHFNRRTFANAGVAESKLRVLHEAVDTHQLFRPPLIPHPHEGGGGSRSVGGGAAPHSTASSTAGERAGGRGRGGGGDGGAGAAAAREADAGGAKPRGGQEGREGGGKEYEGRVDEEKNAIAQHILRPCVWGGGGRDSLNETFRILSVFKWEYRKGWDILLRFRTHI